MKKTIRTVTLFAVLALTAAGCQKEATPETIGNLTVSESVSTV